MVRNASIISHRHSAILGDYLDRKLTREAVQPFNDLAKFTLLSICLSSFLSYVIFIFALIKHYYKDHWNPFCNCWNYCWNYCWNCCYNKCKGYALLPFDEWEPESQLHPFNDSDDEGRHTKLNGNRRHCFCIFLWLNLIVLFAIAIVFIIGQYALHIKPKLIEPIEKSNKTVFYEGLEVATAITYFYSHLCTIISCFIFSKLMYGIQRKINQEAKTNEIIITAVNNNTVTIASSSEFEQGGQENTSKTINGGSNSIMDDGEHCINGGTNYINNGLNTINGGTNNINGGTNTIKGGTVTINGGTNTINNGTVTINGGTYTINGGTVTINGGTNTIKGGTVTINGGTRTINGGVFTINGGTHTIDGGTVTINGGKNTINNGTVTINGGKNIINKGTVTINAGKNTIDNGTVTINGGKNIINKGTVNINAGTNTINNGTVTINGGTNTIDGGTVTINGGTNTINGRRVTTNGGSNTNINNIQITENKTLTRYSDNNNAINGGSNTISGGTNTIKNGSNIVKGGENTIDCGSNTINGGINTINNGSNIIISGTNIIKGGLNTIIDGNNTIYGGYNFFPSKLTTLMKADDTFITYATKTLSIFQLWFFVHWVFYIITSFLTIALSIEAILLLIRATQHHIQPGVHFSGFEIPLLVLVSASNVIMFFYPCFQAASITRARKKYIRHLIKKYKDDDQRGIVDPFVKYLKSREFGFRLYIGCTYIPFSLNIAYTSVIIGVFGIVLSVLTSIAT